MGFLGRARHDEYCLKCYFKHREGVSQQMLSIISPAYRVWLPGSYTRAETWLIAVAVATMSFLLKTLTITTLLVGVIISFGEGEEDYCRYSQPTTESECYCINIQLCH